TKRERSQRVRPPAEAAQDMAGVPLHRLKRGIQCCATNGVIDDIEPFASGVSGNIFFDRYRAIVDRSSAEVFDDALLVGRTSGESFCPEGARKLNRDMADAASSCMDEYFLIHVHLCTVDETLPGCNGAQWQCCRLAHRRILRLVRDQVGIDSDELR